MTGCLRHRETDAVGFWEGAGVSLGMRRLAIIDVATGQQPVFNEDGTIAVVFNGEIYNYVELREALQRAGHRFPTDHSDTEVLVTPGGGSLCSHATGWASSHSTSPEFLAASHSDLNPRHCSSVRPCAMARFAVTYIEYAFA